MPCCGALHRSDAVGLKRGPTNRLLRTGWPRLHRDEDVNRSVGAPRSRLRYQFSRYSDVIEPIRGMGRPPPESWFTKEIDLGRASRFHHQKNRSGALPVGAERRRFLSAPRRLVESVSGGAEVVLGRPQLS